ncbi:MAG: cytochrome P450, partial [Pseudomonadota bacterium]
MRFKPIRIGPHRFVAEEVALKGGTKLPAGSVVMAATHAAMFDPNEVENPNRFDPDRTDPARNMVYGYDFHWCLGAAISNAHMTAIFKALFSQAALKRAPGGAGRMRRLGPFPDRLDLTWTKAPKTQPNTRTLSTVYLPLKEDADVASLQSGLKALGQSGPGEAPDIRAALAQKKVFHFISGSVLPLVASEDGATFQALVFELSADGDQDIALAALADVLDSHMGPLIRENLKDPTSAHLAAILRRGALDVRPFSRAAPGLPFQGTPGLSVGHIHDQNALAQKARELMDQSSMTPDTSALETLLSVRKQLGADPTFASTIAATPSGYGPEKQRSFGAALGAIMRLAFAKPWAKIVGVAAFVFFVGWHIESFRESGDSIWALVPQIMLSIVLVLAVTLLITFGLVVTYLFALRRRERADVPDNLEPSLQHMDAVTAPENKCQNNLLISVRTMKPGRFRAWTLRGVFFAIQLLAMTWFQKGKLMH